MFTRLALWPSVALMVVVLPGQFGSSDIRNRRQTDPKQSLAVALQVPPHIQQTMNKACNNCHSYQTEWPWYSHLIPVKWLIEADVRKARTAVNYSEWTTTAGRRKGTAMGLLAAACEDVRTGRMPPVQYRMIHPEANLRNEEIDSLCTWSRTAMKQLRGTRITTVSIPKN